MADPQEALHDFLRGKYELIDVLGEGGMGTVYLAKDLKHDRQVAIKTIHPDLATEDFRRRFEREITITAQLQHPHILPLLDSGAAGDTLFYVMPYVEGESLRARLERMGKIPVAGAVTIACDVAEALEYAHEHDVIHRDIKPSNIMLTGEHALVVDFGIAKASQTGEGEELTQTGLAVGSPAYMAPEQTVGEATPRSDVYSLAAVLYETVSGRRWPMPPTDSSDWNGIPRALRTVLEQGLSLLPRDRWPDAVSFRNAVRAAALPPATLSSRFRAHSPLVGGVVGLALLGSLALGWSLTRSGSAEPGPRGATLQSIAVLPFADLSPDGDQEYFSDGMSEEILNALAKIPGLQVAARTSSFRFRGRDVDIRAVGESLGVAAVIEGSVRKEGNTVRITAQLINVEDGFHLWSHEFDRQLANVFELQEEIALAIVRELRVRLPADFSGPLTSTQPVNTQAYDLYLKGQQLLWQFSSDGLRGGTEFFERAIELDSAFAGAWAGLAMGHAYLGLWGHVPEDEANAFALPAAQKALELDDALPEAHLAMGVALYNASDSTGAETSLKRAIELNPNNATARLVYANVLMNTFRQRLDEGLVQVKLAEELDPLSPHVGNAYFRYYQRIGDLQNSLEVARSQAELFPNRTGMLYRYANILVQTGAFDEAVPVARRAVALDPDSPSPRSILSTALVYAWDWAGAFEETDKLLEQYPDLWLTHAWKASMLSRHARFDEALAEARIAAEQNPQSGGLRLATVQFRARQYDAALRQTNRASENALGQFSAHWLLSQIHTAEGRYEEAIAEHEAALQSALDAGTQVERPFRALNLAQIYARSGESEKARAILGRLTALDDHPRLKDNLGWIGAVYGTLGETELAFDWLNRGIGAKSRSLVDLKVHPNYDPLRSDPRFAALVKAVGLE